MYCSLCESYISVFALTSFCEYCSKLRRLLLVYGKPKFSEIINRCMGVDISSDEKDRVDVDNDKEIISNLKKSKTIDNLMLELQKRRGKIE